MSNIVDLNLLSKDICLHPIQIRQALLAVKLRGRFSIFFLTYIKLIVQSFHHFNGVVALNITLKA